MKISLTLLILILLQVIVRAESPEQVLKNIDRIISDIPSGTKIGMMIYNPLTQDTIISINHTQSMIPASNVKLFTTAAALEIMSGDYLLSTKILADDKDLTDSKIDGNIYIKGFGHATFETEDLESLAVSLHQAGLREVTGNIIGDDTFFDNVYSRDDWINEERSNVKLPPISSLVLDRNRTTTIKKKRGRSRTYFVNVDNPPLFTAKKLKQLLISLGVKINGEAISGQTPADAKEIIESSEQIRDVLKLINKNSDNFLAECLFKSIGAVYSGKQGNSFFSTQAILSFIRDNGIYSEGTQVVDGSGISRFDKVTVGALAGLLENAYFNINHFEDFYNSLSIAGVDGTLEDRLIGTLAENNFRGKTGTLNGVCSLSGYLTTADGDDLIICIFFEFNKGGAKKYRDIQDKIIEYLAGWENKNPDLPIDQGLK
ncbi:MAG: D-alanyl-D-alanine carboxypeptidase/D-alanyl-D-alanine-endopeptidase [Ignavibacteriales bacterium]